MLEDVTCERIVFRNGVEVSTPMLPALVDAHRCRVPGTPELERRGQDLLNGNFTDTDLLRCLIRAVCAWGGHPQLVSHILAANEMGLIQRHFRGAAEVLGGEAPDVAGALQEINNISYLRQPTYASKHLRFLKPDVCPVLDGKISGRFGHPLDANGYRCLSQDCLKIAQRLRECGVVNPMNRPDNEWLAADVEMGLFASAQDWPPEA